MGRSAPQSVGIGCSSGAGLRRPFQRWPTMRGSAAVRRSTAPRSVGPFRADKPSTRAPWPPGDGSVSAAVRRSPSEQVKRHAERRRTAADEGESGAMVVKMVVKNRCPHLQGPPADSSGSVVTERGRDEGGIDYRSLMTGMAVARSIPRPPVDALLVPQSRARGSPACEVVRVAQVRRLGRSPSFRPVQRRPDRVAVPVAVLVSRARARPQADATQVGDVSRRPISQWLISMPATRAGTLLDRLRMSHGAATARVTALREQLAVTEGLGDILADHLYRGGCHEMGAQAARPDGMSTSFPMCPFVRNASCAAAISARGTCARRTVALRRARRTRSGSRRPRPPGTCSRRPRGP